MTPDEHAAEAERLIDIALGYDVDPVTAALVQAARDDLALAQVHALLATRPTPPAELTDGPTPPFTGGERMTWIPEQSPRRPTIIDYDRAMKNAMDALHEAMPHHIRITHTRLDVLPWAKAAVDAFADTPTTET